MLDSTSPNRQMALEPKQGGGCAALKEGCPGTPGADGDTLCREHSLREGQVQGRARGQSGATPSQFAQGRPCWAQVGRGAAATDQRRLKPCGVPTAISEAKGMGSMSQPHCGPRLLVNT